MFPFRLWCLRLVLLATALTGCASPVAAPNTPVDAAPTTTDTATTDTATDVQLADSTTQTAGASPTNPQWDLPGIAYTLTPGAPIDAPLEQWTWVPLAGAKCANGTPTGVAIQRTTRSQRILLYLQGGGACWEAAACAAGTATHITDTMGEKAVLAEAQAAPLQVIFNRDAKDNPFRDATFVYVPYCTGDLHVGTAATVYDWFGPKTVHHVGASNLDALLGRLAATFGQTDRVWLMGASAGGYGATLNWWRVQKALPWARVDVVNDSGLMLDPAPDGRWQNMVARWKIAFVPGCPQCPQHLSAALDYQLQLLGAPRRYGQLSWLQDKTIALYFGLTGPQEQQGLLTQKAQMPSHAKLFLLSGNEHVVLATPAVKAAGVTALQWLQQLASDAPDWQHAGP